MGGEQAAGVMAQGIKDALAKQGQTLSAEEENAIKQPIRDQSDSQSNPLLRQRTAMGRRRIDPADTRMVLGLALSASLNAPIEQTRFGVFRMVKCNILNHREHGERRGTQRKPF